jgi:hypothetical protein
VRRIPCIWTPVAYPSTLGLGTERVPLINHTPGIETKREFFRLDHPIVNAGPAAKKMRAEKPVTATLISAGRWTVRRMCRLSAMRRIRTRLMRFPAPWSRPSANGLGIVRETFQLLGRWPMQLSWGKHYAGRESVGAFRSRCEQSKRCVRPAERPPTKIPSSPFFLLNRRECSWPNR